MDHQPLSATDARAFVTARWSELEGALNGYPVGILLDDCVNAFEADGAARARVLWLAEHILSSWLAAITRDIEQLPTPTTDIQQVIRQRMVQTHDALTNVKALVWALGEDAWQEPPAGAPG